MPKRISLSAFIKWLGNTEMFTRPSKKLPGKWELFEYYYEPEKELVHFEESQIKAEKLFCEIHFADKETFQQKTNLSVPLLSKMKDGSWSISRNFVTIINPNNFRDNVEFQFAINKGVLKLLKKDAFGRIEFFGFFRNTV